MTKGYVESLHPRGRTGEWIEKLYHGTNVKLSPGDVIVPASQGPKMIGPTHEGSTHYTPEHVYLTTGDHLAERYAVGRAGRHGGSPRVYEVEPVGDVALDPEFVASGFGSDQRVVSAARVVREVPLPGLMHWNEESQSMMRGPAPSASSLNDPHLLTRGEFDAVSPSYEWGNRPEIARRFDALPDDAEVWLYHATSYEDTARAMAADGIDAAGKPMNLARSRYERGEQAMFQPGAGAGGGLYVGFDPRAVDGYGRWIVAVKVRKGDVSPPPEQLGATAGQALSVADAMVMKRILPENVRLIGDAARGVPVADQRVPKHPHEEFVKAATLREASFTEVLHPRDRLGKWRDVVHYVRSLKMPNVHVVGGAVRDEVLGKTPKDHDFIVVGHGPDEIKAMLNPHGRTDDLVVAGKHVGVRFYPHDAHAKELAPGGIEFVPPRTEVSTGPGHKDFEIKADSTVPFTEDALRRDFTGNAIARNIETGELLDPLGGAADLRAGLLRVIGPTSFRDDPLRIVRGLRFISQHGLNPDQTTLDQMTEHAASVGHLSGERVGPEMDKLLMGAEPMKALRIARDTGVLTHLFPELAPTVGFEQESRYHGLTADEHIFHVVQAMADGGMRLPVRWAGLFHDSGKPESAWLGPDGRLHYYENHELGKAAHEVIGAEKAGAALDRLAHLARDERARVVSIVHGHMFQDHNHAGGRRARRFLAKHGDALGRDLIDMKRADVRGKESDRDEAISDELVRLDEFERRVDHELIVGNAFTRSGLAINGSDLVALGYPESPKIGAALDILVGHVIGDPALNNRDFLTGEAARMLKEGFPEREAGPSGTAANRAVYEDRVAGMGSGSILPPVDDSLSEIEAAEIAILRYVLAIRKMRGGGGEGWLYMNQEDSVLRHGRVFRKLGPTDAKYDPEYTVPKQCYSNALHLAMEMDGMTYVEGWAMPPGMFPVHHAWLVDRRGFVHDPTWDHAKGEVYIGIPLKTDFVAGKVTAGGTYGVLEKLDPREDLSPHVVPYPLEATAEQRAHELGLTES